MPHVRIRDAAVYLGVSDDTVRRWVDRGLLAADQDESGRMVVDGHALAQVARDQANPPAVPGGVVSSARIEEGDPVYCPSCGRILYDA